MTYKELFEGKVIYVGYNADGEKAWSQDHPGIMREAREVSPSEVVAEFEPNWKKAGLTPEKLKERCF